MKNMLCLLLMLAFLSACSGGQAEVQVPTTVAVKATTLTPKKEVSEERPPAALEPEETFLAETPPLCTANGRFTSKDGKITLQVVCIRKLVSASSVPVTSISFGDPLVIAPKKGRLLLPFKDAYLLPKRPGFLLVATLSNGTSIRKLLRADANGIFSFEDEANQLVMLD